MSISDPRELIRTILRSAPPGWRYPDLIREAQAQIWAHMTDPAFARAVADDYARSMIYYLGTLERNRGPAPAAGGDRPASSLTPSPDLVLDEAPSADVSEGPRLRDLAALEKWMKHARVGRGVALYEATDADLEVTADHLTRQIRGAQAHLALIEELRARLRADGLTTAGALLARDPAYLWRWQRAWTAAANAAGREPVTEVTDVCGIETVAS
jgi:hypothetical protein